jgi:hypothetical protein
MIKIKKIFAYKLNIYLQKTIYVFGLFMAISYSVLFLLGEKKQKFRLHAAESSGARRIAAVIVTHHRNK